MDNSASILRFLFYLASFLMVIETINGIFQPSHDAVQDSADAQTTGEVDLVTRLKLADESGTYTDAIEQLTKMKSHPACYANATMLVGYCQSIKDNPMLRVGYDEYLNLDLEGVKNIYAVRLALCDFDGMRVDWPAQCSVAYDSDLVSRHVEPSKYQYPHGPTEFREVVHVNLTKIQPCFKALHSRPQWWTTFTAAKEHASTWCELSRQAVEKEEVLKTATSVVNVMGNASSKLSESLQFHEEYKAEVQSFLEKLDGMALRFTARFQNQNATMETFFNNLFAELRFAAVKTMNSVDHVGNKIDILSDNISDSIKILNVSVQATIQSIRGELARNAALEVEVLKDNQFMVEEVNRDLEKQDFAVRRLTATVEQIVVAAQSVSDTLTQMKAEQDSFSQDNRAMAISLRDTGDGYLELQDNFRRFQLNSSDYYRDLYYQQQLSLKLHEEVNALTANHLADLHTLQTGLRTMTTILNQAIGMFRWNWSLLLCLPALCCWTIFIWLLYLFSPLRLKHAFALGFIPCFVYGIYLMLAMVDLDLLIDDAEEYFEWMDNGLYGLFVVLAMIAVALLRFPKLRLSRWLPKPSPQIPSHIRRNCEEIDRINSIRGNDDVKLLYFHISPRTTLAPPDWPFHGQYYS